MQFVLAHEGERRTLRFGRLEGATGKAILANHPGLAGADSVVWQEPESGRALVRSGATDAVLRYLGGRWRVLGALLAVVPRPIRDAVYDLVARHRHAIVHADVCVVPTPEQRARFLDHVE